MNSHELNYDSVEKSSGAQWTTVVIVVLTWLMSAALTYGIVSTKVNYLEERLKIIEDRQQYVLSHIITREEYQAEINRLQGRMDDRDKELLQRLEALRDLILRTHPR